VYSRRKNLRKGKVAFEEGWFIEEGEEPSGQEVQASDKACLSYEGHDHNFDRVSAWVMDHIIHMCKRMGLAIEGREMELLACLASLEANKESHVGD